MTATRRAIKTEDYPLTAPMFLYLPARRLPKLVREFLAFTREPAAQLVIRRAGFVDQLPEEIAIDDQGDRFANAVLRAGEDVRLAGSAAHGAGAQPAEAPDHDVPVRARLGPARCAVALECRAAWPARSKAASTTGGSWSSSGFRTAKARPVPTAPSPCAAPSAVRDAVIRAAETAELDRLKLETDAFGEAMPMACDDSEWGRRANRRVEVWVR